MPELIEKELEAMIGRESSEDEQMENRRRIVWAGGIRRFEKNGLVFESGEVPVIYGFEYLEWIASDPAISDGDMVIESEKLEGNIYRDVKITTGGFILEADKGRIVRSKGLVEIRLGGK